MHEPFKVADPRIDLENTNHARRDSRITCGVPPTANQRCQAASVLLDRRQSRSQLAARHRNSLCQRA
jgi:hypothetical protein